MSTLSTHVLDTAAGRPAVGVSIVLERIEASGITPMGKGVTDADGRLRELVPPGTALAVGTYRLRFDTGAYFDACGVADRFYDTVAVDFHVGDAAIHYHVPLLLSPFGYCTYRGS